MSSPKVVVGFKKGVMLTLAGIFFVLGVLGAFLPGLPATPFLILTSFFLIRTSPSLNAKLRNSRLFGPILTDWEDYGGVRKNVKVKAIVVVAISVGLTIYFGPPILWLRWLIAGLAFVGVLVIYRLPTPVETPSSSEGDAV